MSSIPQAQEWNYNRHISAVLIIITVVLLLIIALVIIETNLSPQDIAHENSVSVVSLSVSVTICQFVARCNRLAQDFSLCYHLSLSLPLSFSLSLNL